MGTSRKAGYTPKPGFQPRYPVGELNEDGLPMGGFTKHQRKAYKILCRREKVGKYLLQDYSVKQIAKMLEVDMATIYTDIKVLFYTRGKSAQAIKGKLFEKRVAQIELIANFTWRRLERIKNPASGSKLIEELRKCYVEICKLEGHYPEKNITMKHTVEKINKSQRDAIAEAAVNSANSPIRLLPPVVKKDGTDD